MKDDQIIIEHDPDEIPRKRSWYWDRGGIYWVGLGLVALAWAGQLYFSATDWYQIALGFFTGGMLATYAMCITGNSPPDSWSGKQPPALSCRRSPAERSRLP